MRWALCLLLLPLAGCVESAEPTESTADSQLSMFVFWMEDAARMPGQDSGLSHDYMIRVTNDGDAAASYALRVPTIVDGRLGPVRDSWEPVTIADSVAPQVDDILQPGASRLWIVQAAWSCCHQTTIELETGGHILTRDFETQDGGNGRIEPGTHVQTVTVGVWTNGTSFYTNSAELHGAEGFPRGYPVTDFDATPLPVYVYDQDRTEQPPGSQDTCHFTTITGYNTLLKEQGAGTSGVRFLSPEEGYTVAGAEDHFLYGESLIFMNAIVAIDGAVDTAGSLPDPTGACFDVQNTVDFVTGMAPL